MPRFDNRNLSKSFTFQIASFYGIFLILASFFINPTTLEELFANDPLSEVQIVSIINGFQFFTVFFGFLFLYFSLKLSISNEKLGIIIFKGLGFLAFFLIICELIVRNLINIEPTGYTGLEINSREWMSKNVENNQFGYRDYDFELEKPKDVTRVLIVGGSTTFGQGVEFLAERFSQVFQLEVKKQNPEIEVINFSKIGWTLKDQVQFITDESINYSPDYIFMVFEPETVGTSHFNNFENYYSGLIVPQSIRFFLLKFSYFHYYFESRISKILESSNLKKTYFAYLRDLYIERGTFWKNFVDKKVDRVQNFCKNNNIQLVAVTIPAFFNLQNYPLEQEQKDLLKFFDEKGIKTVDAVEGFLGKSEEGLVLSNFDFHPNSKGQAMIGKFLTQKVIEQGILMPYEPETTDSTQVIKN
ncbi:SGNH/GDSL hydrolase family protein [bacterium]|nr:SGNH/GDSL hydrolase family protein [bacterium]